MAYSHGTPLQKKYLPEFEIDKSDLKLSVGHLK